MNVSKANHNLFSSTDNFAGKQNQKSGYHDNLISFNEDQDGEKRHQQVKFQFKQILYQNVKYSSSWNSVPKFKFSSHEILCSNVKYHGINQNKLWKRKELQNTKSKPVQTKSVLSQAPAPTLPKLFTPITPSPHPLPL